MIIQVYTDILLQYCRKDQRSKTSHQNARIIESIMQLMMLNIHNSNSSNQETTNVPRNSQLNSISNIETSGSQQRALQMENNKLKEIIKSHSLIIENLKKGFEDRKEHNSKCLVCGTPVAAPGPEDSLKQANYKKRDPLRKKALLSKESLGSPGGGLARIGGAVCAGPGSATSSVDQTGAATGSLALDAHKLKINLGANLEDIKVEQNFQDEFMSKFNEFSLSWR